jgi:hypothetical protein
VRQRPVQHHAGEQGRDEQDDVAGIAQCAARIHAGRDRRRRFCRGLRPIGRQRPRGGNADQDGDDADADIGAAPAEPGEQLRADQRHHRHAEPAARTQAQAEHLAAMRGEMARHDFAEGDPGRQSRAARRQRLEQQQLRDRSVELRQQRHRRAEQQVADEQEAPRTEAIEHGPHHQVQCGHDRRRDQIGSRYGRAAPAELGGYRRQQQPVHRQHRRR